MSKRIDPGKCSAQVAGAPGKFPDGGIRGHHVPRNLKTTYILWQKVIYSREWAAAKWATLSSAV